MKRFAILTSLVLSLVLTAATRASVNVDLGYVNYSYNTDSYDSDGDGRNDRLSMYADLGSIFKVEHASASIRPYESYWPSEKGSPQFVASAWVHGSLDNRTNGSSGNFSESLSHDGRYLSFSESSSLYTGREWQNGDENFPTGQYRDNASLGFNFGDGFSVQSSYGDYREYSWMSDYDGVTQEHWSFSYNVTWNLLCTNPLAETQLSAMGVQGVSITAVPEPTILSFLGIGAIGLMSRRRKM
ncbi:MAG: PEP-CTERM sorting domain-containing protein [Candidatus Paceibacterota bacterium]|jgi:hypothetical protein